jgi:hypothetical protein
MPGWGRSFSLALKSVIVGFLFALLGVIIIVGGVVLGLLSYYAGHETTALVVAVVLIVIGFCIAGLGFYAALIKYSVQEALKEIAQKAPAPVATAAPAPAVTVVTTPTAAQPCPRCGAPLTFVPQANRWYCGNCQQYV